MADCSRHPTLIRAQFFPVLNSNTSMKTVMTILLYQIFTLLLQFSTLGWINVWGAKQQLYPHQTVVIRQGWLSNFNSQLSANLSKACPVYYILNKYFLTLHYANGTFTLCLSTDSRDVASLLNLQLIFSFTPHDPGRQTHSSGKTKYTKPKPARSQYCWSSCKLCLSFRQKHGLVWLLPEANITFCIQQRRKKIETWVQVIKPHEDERISYRLESSDLCFIELIPWHFFLALLLSLPCVLLKFPIRKHTDFQL